jgi:L-lactate dehydrogenase complex protein LldE
VTIDVFIPCFIDQLYPDTAFNMIKVLEKAGCVVRYNPKQTCCGQPGFNAGYVKDAERVAEKFINDFEEDRYLVIPSASCTGFIRNYYGAMFENSSYHNASKRISRNVMEFAEFLVNVMKKTDFGAELHGTATYHDSCGALRECGVKEEPRKLLSHVKGLELREMTETETCCGFGGTFSVKFEPISIAMGEQKLENAQKTNADFLVSSDWSCMMHLNGMIQKRNLSIKCMHLADVLASGWS